MSKQDDLEKQLIDDYYSLRENGASHNISENIEDDFTKKLHSSMSKMDALANEDFNLEINILGIISEGEEIRLKAEDRKEFIKFIFTAALILTSIVLLTVFVNHNIFIYWQLIVFSIIPFTLIPLAKYSLSKEGS
jgi:hypothetical protein